MSSMTTLVPGARLCMRSLQLWLNVVVVVVNYQISLCEDLSDQSLFPPIITYNCVIWVYIYSIS